MITRKDKLGSTDIISLISLYLCAIFYFEVNLYKICLWGLIPISFLLSFLRHNTITRNPYLRIIIVLFTWCCITFVTALDTEIAAKELPIFSRSLSILLYQRDSCSNTESTELASGGISCSPYKLYSIRI